MTQLGAGYIINNRYELLEYKGSGSFGEVWHARDKVLCSEVALKIYVSLDPRGIEEFKSEYFTTEGISHPNLLTTTYFDVWEEHPFLVMKYCADGASANKVGNISEKELWHFIHDVAAGLNALHSLAEPIVHQDIKPDNILMDNGRFLITDFGISKKVRSTMRKQSKRAVGAGATAYMGPERFGSDPTPIKASDIWSLGASIYEMASGELPFSGMGGVMQKNGADLPVLSSPWSEDLNFVLHACLDKNPWDRPTGEQLMNYAQAIIEGKKPTAEWKTKVQKKKTETQSAPKVKTAKWYYTGAALVAIIIAFILIGRDLKSSSDQIDSNEKPAAHIVDSDTEPAMSSVETTEIQNPDILEATHSEEKINDSAAKEVQTKEQQIEKKASKRQEESVSNSTPDYETVLNQAVKNSDYNIIRQLADLGYAPAYIHLAKYYLQNQRYDDAAKYAQKAKKAGYSSANAVIESLSDLGYYD